MATDFLRALETEIEDLQAALEADPRFIKLRELQRIRNLYGGEVIPKALTSPPAPAQKTTPVQEPEDEDEFVSTGKGMGRRASPERAQLKASVVEILRGRTIPTPTGMLVRLLMEKGQVPPGASPANNLSAMLSQAKADFMSHGRAGWTLIEGPDKGAEAADASFAGRTSAASKSPA
jgi:hypothetical protein